MTRRARAGLSLAVVCALLFAATGAFAQRVVLVRAGKQDAVLVDAWNRLSAELRIHHFEPETVDIDENANPARAVSDAARSRSALAGVAFVHQDGKTSVDVWLVDRMSGKTTLRSIVVKPGDDASSVLAIRTVDLLRASLREFEPGERPPADVAEVDRGPVPEAVSELSKPPPSRVNLEAALSVFADSSFGVAYGPGLGAFYRVPALVSVGGWITGPLAGARYDASTGSATMEQELAFLESRVFAFYRPRFDTGVILALGGYHLAAQGQPFPPRTSRSEQAWSLALATGPFVEVRPFERVGVRLSGMMVAMLPKVAVAVGPESRTFRVPILVSLGVAVDL